MTTAASLLSRPGTAFPKAAPLPSLLALQAWAASALPLRPLSLRRGNVVRIENGAGTHVHVHFACGGTRRARKTSFPSTARSVSLAGSRNP